MVSIAVTPSPGPYDRILTGEFHTGPNYGCHRPQGTADWLLIHTIGGRGALKTDQDWHDLERGDIILCQPNSPHRYQAQARTWDLLWAHFHPRREWLEWLRWPVLGFGWRKLRLDRTNHRKIQIRLRQMHRYASRPEGRGRHDLLAMNALEEVLLWCDACNRSQSTPLDERTQVVLDLLSSRYAEPLRLPELARSSGQSVARMTRRFREQCGMSLQKYLEDRRLERSRQLLARTTLSVKEISAQTGFNSPYYFSLRFKAATGASPRLFRARMH